MWATCSWLSKRDSTSPVSRRWVSQRKSPPGLSGRLWVLEAVADAAARVPHLHVERMRLHVVDHRRHELPLVAQQLRQSLADAHFVEAAAEPLPAMDAVEQVVPPG